MADLEKLKSTLDKDLIGLDWQARLKALPDLVPDVRSVFSTSFGLEDQVMTDVIGREKLPIHIFTLDTGRLFEKTYETFQKTLDRYDGLKIETFYPDSEKISAFVTQKGINGFYDSIENRHECCHIRKVEPLGRALKGADIWISGLRREQSARRADFPMTEIDTTQGVLKFYPLIDMSLKEIEEYIHTNEVPYNPLHDQGYLSIGCAPCTRAVKPGEGMRAGRWWWEKEQQAESVSQECGLHLVGGKLVRTKNAKGAGHAG